MGYSASFTMELTKSIEILGVLKIENKEYVVARRAFFPTKQSPPTKGLLRAAALATT